MRPTIRTRHLLLTSLAALATSSALPLPAQSPAPPAKVAAPAATTAPAVAPAPKPAKLLTVTSTKPDALYKVGEEVTFKVSLAADSPVAPDAEITWNISKDGVPPIKEGKARLNQGSVTLTSSLPEAGFLLCRVTALHNGKPVTALGGAGVEPLSIKPSLPVPDDFDAFWADQKKKVAAVPLNPRLTPVKSDVPKTGESYDVQLDCIGAPVSGYFCKPAGAAPKSLPAVLLVHGAGVRSSQLNSAANWSNNGALAMDINAHGLPNGRPDEFYKDVDQSVLKDYRAAINDSREGCYYLGMFRRLMQAMNFLCAQPEWDGKTLIVYGSSQGGFQAFAAAALDERVTFFAAGVPAGCDHTGMEVNRIAGWPKFPIVDKTGVKNTKALEASRYFDAVNFAARTKAKAGIVTVGFIDTTCPPTSVYAAYNALPLQNKSIYNDIPSGHSNSPQAVKAMTDAAVAQLKAGKGAAE